MSATMSKGTFVKDENGNQLYTGLDKFREKCIKQAERQNKKVSKAHAEGRLTSFSIIDAAEYAETMIKIYGHQFRTITYKPM
jgi:hypothetical protein